MPFEPSTERVTVCEIFEDADGFDEEIRDDAAALAEDACFEEDRAEEPLFAVLEVPVCEADCTADEASDDWLEDLSAEISAEMFEDMSEDRVEDAFSAGCSEQPLKSTRADIKTKTIFFIKYLALDRIIYKNEINKKRPQKGL